MNQSDKTVRDGVMLVASYHFLMAILSLVGALAILIFAILPAVSTPATPNSIFIAAVGVVVGIFLAIFYGVTGSGLIQLKNSARMGAVFLALFGTIAGLFVLIGAGIPAINKLLPDMAAVAGVIVSGLCGYALLTVLDLTVLTFLFNRRVRSLFYGEPYAPEHRGNSLSDRIRSTFMDETEEEYEVVPVKKVQPKQQTKPQAKAQPKTQSKVQAVKEAPVRETPVRRSNPPEQLDAPGDLFTEPTTRK